LSHQVFSALSNAEGDITFTLDRLKSGAFLVTSTSAPASADVRWFGSAIRTTPSKPLESAQGLPPQRHSTPPLTFRIALLPSVATELSVNHGHNAGQSLASWLL
jgi:hypothetical protein